jgi:hypothetical protein
LMKKRKEKVPQPDAEQHKAQTGRDWSCHTCCSAAEFPAVFVLEEKNNFKSMKKLYWKEIVNGNDNNDLESTNLLKIIKILIIQPGQLIFYYQDTSSFNKISKQICDLITYNSNC